MESSTLPKPGTKVVRVGSDGGAWIEGFRCDNCGAVVTVATMACRSCASRTPPLPFRATDHGKLFSWSVVHRSYPGIAVPFVSAIVDLDDGLSLKGTLRNADASALKSGMPVTLVLDDAGGSHDKDGAPYVGYHFVPAGAVA